MLYLNIKNLFCNSHNRRYVLDSTQQGINSNALLLPSRRSIQYMYYYYVLYSMPPRRLPPALQHRRRALLPWRYNHIFVNYTLFLQD